MRKYSSNYAVKLSVKCRQTIIVERLLYGIIINKVRITKYHHNNNYTFTAAPQGTYTYTLEVWGAEGGWIWDVTSGAKGGYAKGNISLTAASPLYVCVGGYGNPRGDSASGYAGGYNGGGSGNSGGAGGGGCTHIAKSNKRGVLKNYESYKSEVLIVAGGGGGSERVLGGAGGGTTGGTGATYVASGYTVTQTATGGSQTAGGRYGTTSNVGNGTSGSFGQGGNGIASSGDAGGAGGGGWYGGGGIAYASGGGGGSGYIGGVTSGSMSSGVRSGHGYATITLTRW